MNTEWNQSEEQQPCSAMEKSISGTVVGRRIDYLGRREIHTCNVVDHSSRRIVKGLPCAELNLEIGDEVTLTIRRKFVATAGQL